MLRLVKIFTLCKKKLFDRIIPDPRLIASIATAITALTEAQTRKRGKSSPANFLVFD
jgi:hypothetical protein